MITKMSRIGAAIAAAAALACLAATPAQAVPGGPNMDRWARLDANASTLRDATDPDAVWAGFSTEEQDELSGEFDGATVAMEVVEDDGSVTPVPSATTDPSGSQVSAARAAAFSGCWSRSIEAVWRGGKTNKKMFGVGQRTEVCVKNKKVTSVKVLSPYKTTYGYIGIRASNPTTATYNASWEGRGVARVEGTFGITIPKAGTIGAKRTICAKLYLNANGKSLRGSGECQA